MYSKIALLFIAFAAFFSFSTADHFSASPLIEEEPNDTREAAHLIKSGDSISGKLEDVNDVDFLKFETSANGLAHLDLKSSPGEYWWIDVYDTEGNFLDRRGADSAVAAAGYSRLTIGLKKGTYFISVHGDWGTDQTDYTIKHAFEKAAFFEGEFNNTFETANSIKVGHSYQGKLSEYEDQADIYQVEIDQNGELAIAMNQDPYYKWRFTLYDSNGQYIGSLETDKATKEAKTKSFNYRLKQGKYYIKVTTHNLSTPIYTLTTSFKADEFFEKEPNNSPDAANTLLLNQTLRGQFFFEKDPADYFKFVVEQPGTYRLTQKQSHNAEWDLYLYDSQLNRVGWKQTTLFIDPKAISYVDLEQHLQPGTYYAAIEPAQAAFSSIDYQLTLTSVDRPPFKDVPIGHPFFNEIHLMKSKQIILGHSDGSYKPKDSLLRHHAALIIERSGVDLTPIRAASNFSDVPKSHPSYSSIQKLYRAGIIDGADGKFDPNGTLTREQMAKILVKAFKLQKQTGTSPSFSDVPPNRWSYDYVNILASNGITVGYNGKFTPAEKLTREHYAVFLSRVWANN